MPPQKTLVLPPSARQKKFASGAFAPSTSTTLAARTTQIAGSMMRSALFLRSIWVSQPRWSIHGFQTTKPQRTFIRKEISAPCPQSHTHVAQKLCVNKTLPIAAPRLRAESPLKLCENKTKKQLKNSIRSLETTPDTGRDVRGRYITSTAYSLWRLSEPESPRPVS